MNGYRNDEAGPIHLLVEKYKVALLLHPEWGTKPNVFYVPSMSPPKIGILLMDCWISSPLEASDMVWLQLVRLPHVSTSQKSDLNRTMREKLIAPKR